MNQKRAKAIRRQIRKSKWQIIETFLEDTRELKFKQRLKLAWMILTKKTSQKTSA